jgi:hypothetical protein
MAYVEPQESKWTGLVYPVNSDFARMEGNARANHDAVVQEVIDRDTVIAAEVSAEEARAIADVDAEEARAIADVDAEEARAIAAENAIVGGLTIAGAVGSYAFLKNLTGVTIGPGTSVSSASLVYSDSTSTIGGANPSGTWRCMGYVGALHVTLFVRIS